MDYSTKGWAMLFVMSAYNAILGLLMVNRFVPIMTGMALSFLGMGIVFGVSVMVLMPGEKPWRRPKHTSTAAPKLSDDAEYWNNLIRKDK